MSELKFNVVKEVYKDVTGVVYSGLQRTYVDVEEIFGKYKYLVYFQVQDYNKYYTALETDRKFMIISISPEDCEKGRCKWFVFHLNGNVPQRNITPYGDNLARLTTPIKIVMKIEIPGKELVHSKLVDIGWHGKYVTDFSTEARPYHIDPIYHSCSDLFNLYLLLLVEEKDAIRLLKQFRNFYKRVQIPSPLGKVNVALFDRNEVVKYLKTHGRFEEISGLTFEELGCDLEDLVEIIE